jgi:phage terminase large subunit GpA-like protein
VSTSPQHVIDPRVVSVFNEAAELFRPPPKVTVTEWAEAHRILSTESSSTAGIYRSDVAPYQRDMMNAVNIPGVEKITYFTAGQIGKSLCLENILAYFCVEDPCPIIVVWPTEKVAKDWSADTLDPLIRDTPEVAAKFSTGARKTQNQALFKKITGGSLSIIGANSPSELRRRRARVVIFEEIDAYKASAGGESKGEGDPRKLVEKRQETYWDSVQLAASTCTFEGRSAIAASYADSNMQKYWVPCPHCSETAAANESFISPAQKEHEAGVVLDGYQVLHWYRKEGTPGGMYIDPVYPHDGTAYECAHCATLIDESHKPWMNKHGEWRAQHPERTKHQGFWLSTLYSPFLKARWAKLAESYLEAKAHPENPELLKAFTNMTLAKTWREKYLAVAGHELMSRCEDWTSLPDKVTVLTAGIDVQEDRFEITVKGWGKGQESWCVDWLRIDGDTSAQKTWEALDNFLTNARYLHARGVRLDIASAFIDTGFRAAEVFAYTGTGDRWDRRVCACRGRAGFDKPPLENWNRNNKHRQKVYPLNVDVIKELIYNRLKIETRGPGFLHFLNAKNDLNYFEQLTSERMNWEYRKGYPVRFWSKPPGKRNEALDCEVYATAAFLSLSKEPEDMLEFLREKLLEEAKEVARNKKERLNPDQLALMDMSPIDKDQLVRDGVISPAVGVIEKEGETHAASSEPESIPSAPTEEPYLTQEPEEEEPVAAPAVVRRGNWATGGF